MFFECLKENTPLQFPANRLDFDDYLIGEDFAISPEILCLLTGRKTTKSLNEMIKRLDNDPLILDEHELALS